MKEQAGPVQLQGGLNSCLSVRFTHLWQPQVKFYQFLPKTGKTLSAEQNSRTSGDKNTVRSHAPYNSLILCFWMRRTFLSRSDFGTTMHDSDRDEYARLQHILGQNMLQFR